MNRFTLCAIAAVGLAALPIAGCDMFGGDDGPAFRLRMTDDPFPFEIADSAVVTIRRIELKGGDDSTDTFVLYDGPEVEYNLLDLQDGLDTTLSLVDLPSGDYSQLRIIVSPDARVVLNDGTVHPLRVPSGSQTGIKINLPDFDVSNPDTVDVLVDFDVEGSFHTVGNPDNPQGLRFSFRPVLQIDSLYIDGVPVPRTEFPDGGAGEIYEGG